ncbi:MAG: FadR family transcriptional regulator [Anaerolineales bacterium]|nr:FadR family transcriptional regulator [Anaerolineales bacterium]
MFTIPQPRHASQLLLFLSSGRFQAGDRLPPIPDLANILGISTSKLREQLEVARVMGFVEVRPKTGIRTREYRFTDSVRTSLAFAVSLDPGHFVKYSKFRFTVEAGFWQDAVEQLAEEDIVKLKDIMQRAWAKLHGNPIRIPHEEHRELHLTMFSKLKNPFVLGVLEAYWDAYEAIGLNVFTDLSYLEATWTYHQQIIDAISSRDYPIGHHALVEHMQMLEHRPELGRIYPATQTSEISQT